MRLASLVGFTAKDDLKHIASGDAQEVRRVFKGALVADGAFRGLVRVEYFDTDGGRQKRGLSQPEPKAAPAAKAKG